MTLHKPLLNSLVTNITRHVQERLIFATTRHSGQSKRLVRMSTVRFLDVSRLDKYRKLVVILCYWNVM